MSNKPGEPKGSPINGLLLEVLKETNKREGSRLEDVLEETRERSTPSIPVSQNEYQDPWWPLKDLILWILTCIVVGEVMFYFGTYWKQESPQQTNSTSSTR